MSAVLPVAIGIDLGTTMTSAAALIGGEVKIAHDFDSGGRAIPSYVSFQDDDVLVGSPAKKEATNSVKNTIYDAKRAIGRSFQDKTIQDQISNWPFEIECGSENKPYYKIYDQFYAPHDISAEILRKVKGNASDSAEFGQQEICEAVITVPAQFSDSQRKATIQAAQKAGLSVLKLLNEPTAAATTYIYQDKGREKGKSETILVYDFGGGTLDVSVVRVEDGKITVLGTEGDSYLGGRDIDKNIMEYFLDGEELKEKKDEIKKNGRALNRLLKECEDAKIALSNKKTQKIRVDALYASDKPGEGSAFWKSKITREDFEKVNQKIFEKTLDIVKKCLKNIDKIVDDIDQVVLVGGSSRIPKIQEMLSNLFGGKQPSKGVDPDEAVAAGAAIHAAKLKGNLPQFDIQVDEVLPRNIGVTQTFKDMSVFFKKNTKIPAKKTIPYSNSVDDQKSIRFSVYEGNRYLGKDNNLLGEFTLTDLPPGKRRKTMEIDVTFEITKDGTLHATAIEKSTKKKIEVDIKREEELLTVQTLHEQDEEEKQRKDDKKHVARIKVGRELTEYAYRVKYHLEDDMEDGDVTEEDKHKMLSKAKEIITWIKDHKDSSKDAFSKQLKELEEICKPLGDI